MRDEKFDEFYFDKKKNYQLPGGENETKNSESRDTKRPAKLHEGWSRSDLSNPGISDYSRSETNSADSGETDQIRASGAHGSRGKEEKEHRGWYHGSDDREFQPNNLEAEYYENQFAREPGQAEKRLYEDIIEKIMDTPEVNAQDVQIRVDQTRVLLSGEVDTRKMKETIADIAKYTEGVNGVINDIVVKRRS